MKTLLLMRHAKSSWKQAELQDFDRPLSKRGRKDAPRMGILLREVELIPEKIMASPALRVQMTTELLTGATHSENTVEYYPDFYMAEPDVYLTELKNLPDELERVLVVGHNPGLEGLLQMLTKKVASLPTCAVAYLSLPIKSWQELDAGLECDLIELWRPKEIK